MGIVAAYVRTSVLDREGEGQIAAIETAARQQGVTIGAWFIDRNQSSRKSRRPQMEELRRAAVRGKLERIYTFALDRFGRDMTDLVTLLDYFLNCGVPVISLKERLDFSNAAGRLQTHILMAFAEFERDRIRERTMAWMDYAKSKGMELGRPVGDKRKSCEGTVRKARSAGASYSAIAKSMGLPQTTVYRICNPEQARLRKAKVYL